MTFYKIQRADGLYSKGGCYPKFNKRGKTWSTVGHLKNHLRQFAWELVYKDCRVVEFNCEEPLISGKFSLRNFFM